GLIEPRLRLNAGKRFAPGDRGLPRLESERLRLGRKILGTDERSPRFLGLRSCRALAPLRGQLVSYLGRDLLQWRLAAFFAVDHLDRVVGERRAYVSGRDLPLLQREGGLLELGHQIAGADEAEIAALRGVGGVLGDFPR